MAIHTQQTSMESEQRYSPEEAGEILKLAANLQDDSFTIEQLRAIAREAGIDDQQLSRALEQHERLKQQKAFQQQEKRRRRKRWLVGAGIALVLAVLFASSSVSWVSPAHQAKFPLTGSEVSMLPAVPPLEVDEKMLLASSRSCTVYKFKDSPYERVIIVRPNGEEFMVGHQFEKVTFASISPTGKHIALFDENTGEVLVVDVNGEGLHSVARRGELRGDGAVASKGNPIAGWATYEGKDRLKVRLASGGYSYMFVEQ